MDGSLFYPRMTFLDLRRSAQTYFVFNLAFEAGLFRFVTGRALTRRV